VVTFRYLFILIPLLLLPVAAQAQSSAAVWQAIADGSHIAMMRHARAPGTGDPAGFKVDDCKTQRNLDDRGIEQAKAIGEAFRRNGITAAEVLTSQWCRCRDTAEFLDIGEPQELTALNSFFNARHQEAEQTRSLRAFLQKRQPGEPMVLVTHQVNITALTGVFPTSGEIVVFRIDESGKVRLKGRIRPD
jgi:phosphohistidine phosphatase SixA